MKLATALMLMLFSAGLVVRGNCEEDRWEKAAKQYEEVVRIASRYPIRDFEKAIEAGDIGEVTRLLDSGVPVSLQIPERREDWEGLPPFQQAVHKAPNESMLRLLLDRGAAPNALDSDQNTPLHCCYDLKSAALLVSRGADVNARNAEGSQPIHGAVAGVSSDSKLSLALIKLLVEHGADPLAKDHREEQPIHIAAWTGSPEIVDYLIAHKANVNAAIHDKDSCRSDGWRPIHFAAERWHDPEAEKVMNLLVRHGADVNATTADGETPLHVSNHATFTKLLLQHGAKPDIMSTGLIKRQPIHHFAMRGDVESIKLLLDRGVDIEARSADDDETITPLDTASYWERKETVIFLLERGARPTGRTMMNALRFGNRSIEILHSLHQKGGIVSADVFLKQHPQAAADLLPLLNQENKDLLIRQSARLVAESAGTNYLNEADGGLAAIRALAALGAKTDQPWKGLLPIHHAVVSGKEAVVGYFLSNGQPIDAEGILRDNDSDPPIMITDVQPIHIALGSPELIPYLINKGAKIDAQTGEGWQLVHLAAAHGNKTSLETVIKAGGDAHAMTRDGKTPLQLARKFENGQCAEYLKGLP